MPASHAKDDTADQGGGKRPGMGQAMGPVGGKSDQAGDDKTDDDLHMF